MAEMIEIKKLKPHPKNSEVYGEEDVSELVESIKKHGMHKEIIVNKDFVIISGHRRYNAALEIGMPEVPYAVKLFDSPADEIEALILENAYRPQKTQEQRTKEGVALEEVIAERARKRKLATQNNNASKEIADRDDSSHSEKGRTRDIIAKKTGHTSGKQYEQSKKVVVEIDALKSEGKNDDAALLSNVLEKAPSAAYELVKVGLDNITQDDKDNLMAEKTTVNAIVKQIDNKSLKQSKNETRHKTTLQDVTGLDPAKPQRIYDFINAGIQTLHGVCATIESDIENEIPLVDSQDEIVRLKENIRFYVNELNRLINKIDSFVGNTIDLDVSLQNSAIDEPTTQPANNSLDNEPEIPISNDLETLLDSGAAPIKKKKENPLLQIKSDSQKAKEAMNDVQ